STATVTVSVPHCPFARHHRTWIVAVPDIDAPASPVKLSEADAVHRDEPLRCDRGSSIVAAAGWGFQGGAVVVVVASAVVVVVAGIETETPPPPPPPE